MNLHRDLFLPSQGTCHLGHPYANIPDARWPLSKSLSDMPCFIFAHRYVRITAQKLWKVATAAGRDDDATCEEDIRV